MSMNLYVAKVHKIEYSTPKVCGYSDIEDFIERLNDYAATLEVDGTHENAYGEGYMDYEIPRFSLEEIVKQPDDWFHDDELHWDVNDKAIIQQLLVDADPDERYIYIYCF